MTGAKSLFSTRHFRRAGPALLQAAGLALAVTMVLPAIAADARPMKLRVAPHYPRIAKRPIIEGAVRIKATVDPDGKVSEVKAVSGSRSLYPSAENAVRKWRFVAAPGKSTITVDIVFALR
jgi:TonB family protein